MNKHKKQFGAAGETLAANFLVSSGYEILYNNYKTRVGEIDIIAQDREYIVFIEVKSRTNLNYGRPCQAVDLKKQQKIINVAYQFLQDKALKNCSCRFDVVEIIKTKDKEMQINHIQDAFQTRLL